MEISEEGFEFIKRHEGFSSVPYLCPAGVWTIGYGHTKGVTAYMMPITPASAEDFLREDLAIAESAVNQLIVGDLKQSQFDALVSFVFNVGVHAFARSTLLKRINAGDSNAADDFLRWIYANGKKQRGLEKRRKAEREMFLTMLSRS